MYPRFGSVRAPTIEWTWLAIVAGCLLAALAGLATVVSPMATAAIGGVIVATGLIALGRKSGRLFLAALAILLVGYAFFGRSFAYLGLPPIYVGEAVLGLAGLALLYHVRRVVIDLKAALLLVFMLIGAIATFPYLREYGIDALRDAVIWGYALFALAIAAVVKRHHFDVLVSWYGKLFPIFLIWAPISFVLLATTDGLGTVPGSDVPLIFPKGGDVGVHLAGIGAFLLLGLWRWKSDLRAVAEIAVWALWLVGLAVMGSFNRGGLLSALVALSATMMLRPSRHIVSVLFAVVLLITSFVAIDPDVDLGTGRDVSVEQLVTNVQSIIFDTQEGDLDLTREWRMRWWTDIVNYTVFGEHFWTGKGFGINLADDDGYQVEQDHSLRAPHSSHMTILARAGVPGAVAWIALHAVFGISMIVGIVRAQLRKDTFLGNVMIWLFAYWVAMLVNSSFDVYLEGPQGGIWFWTVFGLGIAAIRIQRQQEESSRSDEDSHSPATRRERPRRRHRS